MQVDVIHSEERGLTQTEWLNSRHSYSFGQYFNLNRLNFGTLRVFNDDIVEPGKGFGTHVHENMEIVTIVLSGILQHKDSKGNRGILKAGDVQRMTAGSGIKHSEMNGSKKEKVHFLQIWIHPEKRGLEPNYEQKNFPPECFNDSFYPIVTQAPLPSIKGEQEPLKIHQDATFYLGYFDPKRTIEHITRKKNRGVYLFVIEGKIAVGNQTLSRGDSAQITQSEAVQIETMALSKILLIEVDINTL